MTELKDFVQKRKEAAGAVASKENQRQNMVQCREKLLQSPAAGFLSKAKAFYDDVFGRFVAGKASEAEAIAAKRKYDEAEHPTAEKRGLVEHLDSRIRDASEELNQLKLAFSTADREAWLALSRYLVGQIKGDLAFRQLVHQAYAARCRSRDFNVDFKDFCHELFEDRELDRSPRLIAGIEKKYLS